MLKLVDIIQFPIEIIKVKAENIVIVKKQKFI